MIILRKLAEATEMRANVNNDRAARGLPPLPPSTLASTSITAESNEPNALGNSIASTESTPTETNASSEVEGSLGSSAAPMSVDSGTEGGGLFL